MRLTLVHPAIGRRPGVDYMRTWQMEPLPIAALAALTPKVFRATTKYQYFVPAAADVSLYVRLFTVASSVAPVKELMTFR